MRVIKIFKQYPFEYIIKYMFGFVLSLSFSKRAVKSKGVRVSMRHSFRILDDPW